MVVGFVVFAIIAREYSKELLGVYIYGQTIALLVLPFLASGCEAIFIREIVRDDDKDKLVGSAFVVLFILSICAITLPLLYVVFFEKNTSELLLIIVVLHTIAFLPTAFRVIEHYFKAYKLAKLVVVPRILALLISNAVKIYVVFMGYSIQYIAVAVIIENTVLAIFLIVLYKIKAKRSIFKWNINANKIKFLFSQALPAVLSGVVVTIFFQVNQIMLAKIGSYNDVAIYSVAYKIFSIFGVIPSVIFSAIYPSMVKQKLDCQETYIVIRRMLIYSFTIIGYIIMIAVHFTGSMFIPLIFGEKYLNSVQVLSIMSISIVFIFSASVRAQYIFIENVTSYHFYNAIFGLIFLLPCSFYFIPVYGAAGAAVSIAISIFISGILCSFLLPKTREIGYEQFRSLTVFFGISYVSKFLHKMRY
jgi:O-antigen/teichoic acid export membrane protein